MVLLNPLLVRYFPSFWLLSGLFFFILIQNWSGLLPGVGTVGYGYSVEDHFKVSKPLIRPGNADLNMTLALALVANLFWVYFIVKFAGVKAIIKDWFGNKADKSEVSSLIFGFLGVIFLAVGLLKLFPFFSALFHSHSGFLVMFLGGKSSSQHVLPCSSTKVDSSSTFLLYGGFNWFSPSSCFYASDLCLHWFDLQP